MKNESTPLLNSDPSTAEGFGVFCMKHAVSHATTKFGMITGALPAAVGAIIVTICCIPAHKEDIQLKAGFYFLGAIGALPGLLLGLIISPLKAYLTYKTRHPNASTDEVKQNVEKLYNYFVKDNEFNITKKNEFDKFIEDILKNYDSSLFSSSSGSSYLRDILSDKTRTHLDKLNAIKKYMTTSTLYRGETDSYKIHFLELNSNINLGGEKAIDDLLRRSDGKPIIILQDEKYKLLYYSKKMGWRFRYFHAEGVVNTQIPQGKCMEIYNTHLPLALRNEISKILPYLDLEKNVPKSIDGFMYNFFSDESWLYNNGKRFFNVINQQISNAISSSKFPTEYPTRHEQVSRPEMIDQLNVFLDKFIDGKGNFKTGKEDKFDQFLKAILDQYQPGLFASSNSINLINCLKNKKYFRLEKLNKLKNYMATTIPSEKNTSRNCNSHSLFPKNEQLHNKGKRLFNIIRELISHDIQKHKPPRNFL